MILSYWINRCELKRRLKPIPFIRLFESNPELYMIIQGRKINTIFSYHKIEVSRRDDTIFSYHKIEIQKEKPVY